MISANGSDVTINDELKNLPSGGILILDFWASWCKPCIAEFPSLKKQKEDFAHLPVSFLPINMDYDRHDANWRKASLEDAYIFKDKDFRASDDSRNKLYNFFKINSIPRYVAIAKNGTIISSNLARPSEEQFKSELMNYLKSVKQ